MHETRCEPGNLRLLAGEPRNPCRARAHGNRAGRHSERSCRCIRADARLQGRLSIRLAGTRPCALFGREIKDESFLDLWASTNRPILEGLLSILSYECPGLEHKIDGLAPALALLLGRDAVPDNGVMLPPGRSSECVKPSETGSGDIATMGWYGPHPAPLVPLPH